MNLISLAFIFVLGCCLWWRSGISPTRRYVLVALGVMAVLWIGVWGQLAIGDGWWTYNGNNVAGGFIGVIPVADLLYFFGGIGWYLYLCRKLNIL